MATSVSVKDVISLKSMECIHLVKNRNNIKIQSKTVSKLLGQYSYTRSKLSRKYLPSIFRARITVSRRKSFREVPGILIFDHVYNGDGIWTRLGLVVYGNCRIGLDLLFCIDCRPILSVHTSELSDALQSYSSQTQNRVPTQAGR